jgi:hypothetical protein
MHSLARVAIAAAMITAGILLGKPVHGQGLKADQTGKPVEPQRNIEESPFGGPPPPMRRGAKARGSKCLTASGSCTVDPAQPVGTTCSCRDGTADKAGKIAQ